MGCLRGALGEHLKVFTGSLFLGGSPFERASFESGIFPYKTILYRKILNKSLGDSAFWAGV